MFLYDTQENWSIQVHFFPFVDSTQPLSHLHVSPCELKSHTQPCIAVSFHIHFTHIKIFDYTAQYCSDLPPDFRHQPTDLDPVLKRHVWTNFCLISCFSNSNAANLVTSASIRTEKKFPFTRGNAPPNLKTHYHSTDLFTSKISSCSLFNKLKQFRKSLSKTFKKPTEVKIDHLAQAQKTF